MTDLARPNLPTETVTLPNGGLMPIIGFGTCQIKGEEAVAATAAALEAGCQHLDTSTPRRCTRTRGRSAKLCGTAVWA